MLGLSYCSFIVHQLAASRTEKAQCINHIRSTIGGATPKFLDGPNLRPTIHVLQTIYDLYATTLRLETNRNHCVMCVKFNKEWKTYLHTRLSKFHAGKKFDRLVTYHRMQNRP